MTEAKLPSTAPFSLGGVVSAIGSSVTGASGIPSALSAFESLLGGGGEFVAASAPAWVIARPNNALVAKDVPVAPWHSLSKFISLDQGYLYFDCDEHNRSTVNLRMMFPNIAQGYISGGQFTQTPKGTIGLNDIATFVTTLVTKPWELDPPGGLVAIEAPATIGGLPNPNRVLVQKYVQIPTSIRTSTTAFSSSRGSFTKQEDDRWKYITMTFGRLGTTYFSNNTPPADWAAASPINHYGMDGTFQSRTRNLTYPFTEKELLAPFANYFGSTSADVGVLRINMVMQLQSDKGSVGANLSRHFEKAIVGHLGQTSLQAYGGGSDGGDNYTINVYNNGKLGTKSSTIEQAARFLYDLRRGQLNIPLDFTVLSQSSVTVGVDPADLSVLVGVDIRVFHTWHIGGEFHYNFQLSCSNCAFGKQPITYDMINWTNLQGTTTEDANTRNLVCPAGDKQSNLVTRGSCANQSRSLQSALWTTLATLRRQARTDQSHTLLKETNAISTMQSLISQIQQSPGFVQQPQTTKAVVSSAQAQLAGISGHIQKFQQTLNLLNQFDPSLGTYKQATCESNKIMTIQGLINLQNQLKADHAQIVAVLKTLENLTGNTSIMSALGNNAGIIAALQSAQGALTTYSSTLAQSNAKTNDATNGISQNPNGFTDNTKSSADGLDPTAKSQDHKFPKWAIYVLAGVGAVIVIGVIIGVLRKKKS